MPSSVPRIRRPYGRDEFAELTAIWKRAVEATHDFLTEADIAFYEQKIRDEYLPHLDVWVAADENDSPLGFLGLSGHHIEMLFVDPVRHGAGVGTALIDDAASRHAELTLDVNEQNPLARDYYLRRGFVETGRTPTDADGRPFPLIQMRRPAER